ncbi:MAG: hypothetical protein OIF32_05970 [Campylobacterales bacterium]|nr:hypothetical protein [Campylobacterales bacterium]
MHNLLSIDLGSNTIRFIEYSLKEECFVNEYEEIVRTGEKISQTGSISQNAIQRIITAIQNAKTKLDFKNSKIISVATASFRIGKNSKEAIGEIYKKTGVKFQVISGDEEAVITANAVRKQALEFGHKEPLLILDLGGASTEIVYIDTKETIFKSFDIGIVTYTDRFHSVEELLKQLEKDKEKFENFLEEIKDLKKPKILASTAGTPTTLAAYVNGLDYCTYDKNKVNNTLLDTKQLIELNQEFKKMDSSQLEVFVGKNRGDLVITGVTILIKLVEFLGFEKTVVFDNSLREGIIYKELNF